MRSAVLLSILLAVSTARAVDVCGPLANLVRYGVLATDHYDATLGFDLFGRCYVAPAIGEGSVCSTTSRFVGGPVVDYGDVVALASTGVAIAIRGPRPTSTAATGSSRTP
jgi:hypothetical protein